MKRVLLLGATGSVGSTFLKIYPTLSEKIKLVGIVANSNLDAYSIARKFNVPCLLMGGKGTDEFHSFIDLTKPDIALNGVSGSSGLVYTDILIERKIDIALANKEALVIGGDLVMRLAAQRHVPILPIDSEHSAIFQCLAGEHSPVRRLIITCSGGALRDLPAGELPDVTPERALQHPQWHMGAKITIDSATLVNKGFEVIEAHWLFGVDPDRISVLIHPQSIVHSMVEFEDGAIKAQLGTPDMHMPISYALMFPRRASRPKEAFDFMQHPELTFSAVDRKKYPALDIAYDCLRRGGTAACTMNGANEVAVAAFLDHKCPFTDITAAIEYALQRAGFTAEPSLEEYAAANAEARALAAEYLRL